MCVGCIGVGGIAGGAPGLNLCRVRGGGIPGQGEGVQGGGIGGGSGA